MFDEFNYFLDIIANEAVQFFLIHDQFSMQYTIPAQNIVWLIVNFVYKVYIYFYINTDV